MARLITSLTAAAFLALQPSPAMASVKADTAATQTDVATLNPVVTVDGNTVTLGHLFQGAVPEPDKVVAFAPAPGKRQVLDVRWLYQVAKANDIPWRPASRFAQTVVERSSRLLEQTDVMEVLRATLEAQGLPHDAQVSLHGHNAALHVPANGDVRLDITHLNMDPRLSRFTATLEVTAPGMPSRTLRLAGRAFTMTDIPVLTDNVPRGNIITAAHIDYMRVRDEEVRRDTVLDADALIGQEAKRLIRGGAPVRQMDVRTPVLVERKAIVQLRLQTPLMTLTAQGQALEDGSDGDVIRVRNLRSDTEVTGIVTGRNVITVKPHRALAQL